MPGELDKVRLVVGGREREDWTAYSLDADLTIPADEFNLTLGTYRPGFFAEIAGGDPVEVYVNNELVLTGFLDDKAPVLAKRERSLTVKGRDKAGILVDCCPDPCTWQNVSLAHVAEAVCSPLGIKIKVQSATLKPYKEVQVKPGQRCWDLLAEYAAKHKLGLWMDVDGTLMIGKPEPSAHFRFYHSTDPRQTLKTNVLRQDVTESVAGRYSRVIVLAQAQGDQWFHSSPAAHIRAEAEDPEMPSDPPRTLVVTESDVSSEEEAKALAEAKINEGRRRGLTATVLVAGHTQDGRVFKPGDTATVESDDIAFRQDMMIVGRTLILDRDGPKTELRLIKEDTWP